MGFRLAASAEMLFRDHPITERVQRIHTLENLNTAADHPGTPFARAADTLALEGWASGDPDAALDAFRDAFTG